MSWMMPDLGEDGFLDRILILCGLLTILATSLPVRVVAGENDFHQQVQADWLQQEESRLSAKITAQGDAAGGCDGVKDGKWGFHTNRMEKPWWQVDLGAVQPVARVLVWNRCDFPTPSIHLELCLSEDGQNWQTVYKHNGTVFYGQTDGKPLEIRLKGRQARYVRVTLSDTNSLHLDEVEVFGAPDATKNLALHRPANQSGLSLWSKQHGASPAIEYPRLTHAVLARARTLAGELRAAGVDIATDEQALGQLTAQVDALTTGQLTRDHYFAARWIQRRLMLANPLLNFDSLLFAKRVPGVFSHMSDQYYGWWSRPGGGLYRLRGFREDAPVIECISGSFKEPGSFLRPTLSYDGRKVLFAWCRFYSDLAGNTNKLDKSTVPEDAFYHVFEMNVDGTGLRQLTHGKYDDFDAQVLPDGRIVFLSTRRGQSIQCDRDSAARTLARPDLPDIYVRCGGDPARPVAVYTLHTMDANGGDLNAISPFEMFEWTPSVAADGTILYSRWDYIDRWNMPWMSLWAVNPDGTNPRLVYKNFTPSPHCTFEPRSIPGSRKIIFNATGHHAQTMGSLALLDPDAGTEGAGLIQRLTPEVCFPETEGWPDAYYANPWPLSERLYLVTWGRESNITQGGLRPANGQGLYLFDASGVLELLYRDPAIGCENPIPLRPSPCPPALVDTVKRDAPKEGRFLVCDVYRGLKKVKRGEVKALRVVAVPGKTQPVMNAPSIGLTKDDPRQMRAGHRSRRSGRLGLLSRPFRRNRLLPGARCARHDHPGHAQRHQRPAGTDRQLRRLPRVAPGGPGVPAAAGCRPRTIQNHRRAGRLLAIAFRPARPAGAGSPVHPVSRPRR